MFDYEVGRHFHFAVVDLDRAGDYPRNFVCILPRISTIKGKVSKFSEIFGKNTIQVAKQLLVDALEDEDDDNIKHEIERRLEILEPHLVYNRVCLSCGKTFQVNSKQKSWQRFCEDCWKKKFGVYGEK